MDKVLPSSNENMDFKIESCDIENGTLNIVINYTYQYPVHYKHYTAFFNIKYYHICY
jgi:hypothetical protein